PLHHRVDLPAARIALGRLDAHDARADREARRAARRDAVDVDRAGPADVGGRDAILAALELGPALEVREVALKGDEHLRLDAVLESHRLHHRLLRVLTAAREREREAHDAPSAHHRRDPTVASSYNARRPSMPC